MPSKSSFRTKPKILSLLFIMMLCGSALAFFGVTMGTVTNSSGDTSVNLVGVEWEEKLSADLASELESWTPSTTIAEDGLILFLETSEAVSQVVEYLQTLIPSWDILVYHSLPILYLKKDASITPELVETIARLPAVQSLILNQRVENVLSDATSEATVEQGSDYEIALETTGTLIGSDVLTSQGWMGDGVLIAVIDSGIDDTHPDLVGQVSEHRSFVTEDYGFESWETEGILDELGHGTGCAGIIAGTGAANSLNQGVAPDAQLLSAKVFTGSGTTTGAAIIAGLDWAIEKNVDIISMSFGGGGADPYISDLVTELQTVVAGIEQDILMIASAGNEGPGYITGSAPAIYPGVLSVGAYNALAISTETDDAAGLPATYSSRGPAGDYTAYPDVLAPSTIWAPLASDSQFEGIFKGLDYNWEAGNGGDYWIFSGTSASAPVVAGAAAILIQRYRSLTENNNSRDPWGIQLAIQKTATLLDDVPLTVQGAGLLNVSRAFQYLDDYYSGGYIDGFIVSPSALPVPPLDLDFPGDTAPFNLTLLTDIPNTFSISVSSSLDAFLTWQSSLSGTTIQGETYVSGTLTVPLNTPPGEYYGVINVTVGNETQIIPVNFTITQPIGRIFVDTIHNIDTTDTTFDNYYLFAKTLRDNGYIVDSYFEVTPFSLTQSRPLLTYAMISQYDIVIIPDIEMAYASSEVAALQRFVEEGGSLLCYGSFPPTFNNLAVNEILEPYGIQYTNEELAPTIDIGISRDILSSYVDITTLNSSHPIMANISRYYWSAGLSLSVNSPLATTLAWYNQNQTLPVLASWDGTSIGQGRVVVFGNEVPIYNRPTNERRFDGSYVQHEQLAENVIAWLLPSAIHLNIFTNVSRGDLAETTAVEVVLSAVSAETHETVNGSLLVTLYRPDNSSISLSLAQVAEGVWSTLFTPSLAGEYTISMNWSAEGSIYYRNVSIELTSNLPVVTDLSEWAIYDNTYEFTQDQMDQVEANPSWTFIDRLGDQVRIAAEIANSTPLQSVTLVLADIPEWMAYNTILNRTILRQSMVYNGSHWVTTWEPTTSNAHGDQLYFVEVVDSQGQVTWSPWREFIIFNYEPTISNTESLVDDESIESISTVITANIGQSLSITISGFDNETDLADCKAYALLYHYQDLNLLIPGVGVLFDTAQEIPFEGDAFKGSFVIPQTSAIPPEDELVFNLSGKMLVLLLILVDPDGDYDVTGIVVQVRSNLLLEDPLTLLVVGLFICAAVAAFVVIYRRFGRVRHSYY